MRRPTKFPPIRLGDVLTLSTLIAGLLLSPSTARAQAAGPTLMDLINGRGQPAAATPAAQQAAPRAAISAPPGSAAATLPPTAPPAVAPASQSRGWYMRADANLGLYQSSSQTAGNCSTTALLQLCGYSANGNTSDVLGVTFGGGYRWTPWLRTDVTYSYRASVQTGGNIGTVGGSPSAAVALASPRANTFFFNAQLDLVPVFGGEAGWFQPYIGVGFGPSINTSRDVPITGTLPTGFSAFTLPSQTHVGFAWNAGAGVAIRLTGDFALDFGYRYVDLGTFTTRSTVAGSPPATVQPLSWNLQQHELYAGFRVAFN